eukprot:TRINITY_DN67063_c2_g6_i1.p1 TRINITY_DN67063_c2_g6~~TRINITY_DN67063_c2_g6_i1.p1  ORF type:complete len:469 (-),score=97.96 TRINITY_DN67063_c2_g6_i1:161-1567(-)
MSGHNSDILSYLGVQIPPEPEEHTQPQPDAAYRYLKPREAPRPPISFGTDDASSSTGLIPSTPTSSHEAPATSKLGRATTPSRRSASPSCSKKKPKASTNGSPPRIISKKLKNGVVQEYVVYQASHPSNAEVNKQMVEQKQRQQAYEKQVDTMEQKSIQQQNDEWNKRIWQEFQRQKEQKHAEWRQYAEIRDQFVNNKKELERQDKVQERAQLEEMVEYERRATEYAQYQKKVEAVECLESCKRIEQERQDRIKQEREWERQQPVSNIAYSSHTTVPREVVQNNREKLLDYWKNQVEERIQKKAEAKEQEILLERETLKQIQQEAINAAQQIKWDRERKLAQSQAYQEMMVQEQQQKQAAEQAHKQHERKQADEEAYRLQQAVKEIKNLYLQQQQQRNKELKRHVQRKEQQKQDERQAEVQQELQRQAATTIVQRKVLYQCPVSGQLLPPEAFNSMAQLQQKETYPLT